jgi:2-(1,2-epoxy-1,2-dihydrophenyl)acetyl-CoA isomerase
MSIDPILVSRDGAVATLRFNRPEALNAIDLGLAEAFETILDELTSDATLRVIVLDGAGRAFMAGGDLSVFRGAANLPDAVDILIGPLHRAVKVMHAAPQIVLASLHGAVAGAGLSIALLADLAVAADTVKLNMAYSRIHAVPDCGGSWALARLTGARKALEIALLSENIDANEALRLGLVNRVVPADRLADETASLAAQLAAQSLASVRGIRTLMRDALSRSLGEQLEAERLAFRAAAMEPDFANAIDGFFARRPKS